jgi:hypothetical protein
LLIEGIPAFLIMDSADPLFGHPLYEKVVTLSSWEHGVVSLAARHRLTGDLVAIKVRLRKRCLAALIALFFNAALPQFLPQFSVFLAVGIRHY